MFSNRRAKSAYPADADVEAFAAANRAPRHDQHYGYAGRDPAAEEDEAVAFERELLAGLNIDLAAPAGASETAYADEAYDPALYQSRDGHYGVEGADPYAYDPNAYDQRAYEPWPDAAYPDIAEGSPYVAAEDEAYAAPPAAPRAARRGARLAVLAAAVLGIGVVGAMAMTFLRDAVSGEPVVVHAPEDPYKIVAEATPDAEAAGASVVFAGDDSDKIEERIVARDETAAPLYDDAEAISPFDGGPRRVRTVVVRPDGSIVDTPASTAELSSPIVDETAMAAVEIDSFPATADMTSDAPLMAGLPDDAPEEVGTLPVETAWVAPTDAVPATPVETVPDAAGPLLLEAAATAPAELTTAPLSGAAPADVAAPPATAPAAPATEVAVAPPPAAPESAATTPPAPGSYVQVSSQRSEAAAQETFADLQRRYPSIFGGQTANVQRADLGDRGIYYRLRVGPMASSNVANEFCMMFRSSGGDCLVVSN